MMLLILLAVLLVLMAAVGGERGSVAFAVLVGDAALCFLGVLLLSYGVSPAAVLTVGCTLLLILTVPIQNGFNPKTLTVLLATAALLVPVSLLVAALCGDAHLAGLDEYQAAQMENSYLSSGVAVDLGSIMTISLVLGQLGAVADTSMTVASSLHEIHVTQPELIGSVLIHSGMEIGRKIIGTTINTLAFIAFGETAMLFLLYIADGYSLTAVLNSKSFFQQFGGILLSCESCLLVIPLTVRIYVAGTRSKRAAALWTRLEHRSEKQKQ